MIETVEEQPFTINCEGEFIVGVLHAPNTARNTAIVMMPAGELQYRVGCGRQLVEFAREVSGKGFPVVRFDPRGVGDSSGEYVGVDHVGSELKAVIARLKTDFPEVNRVVLWGGCAAASGIMMHTHSLPEVSGWILSNPAVKSRQVRALAHRGHYLRRLRDAKFWRKVFTLQYNPWDYAKAFAAQAFASPPESPRQENPSASDGVVGNGEELFMQRMLDGVQEFTGSALLVMSGRSLIRAEFDVLLEHSSVWKTAFGEILNQRVDIPDADQTFSTRTARRSLIEAAINWIEQHDRAS